MSDSLQAIKERRDAALARLLDAVPFAAFLGLRVDRRGDELTVVLPFREELVGNPMRPSLHGGATAGFLEVAAVLELAWAPAWEAAEAGIATPTAAPLRLPKTIDLTVDYLRPGLARDAYARARVTRSGRRYASVFVEAWQDNRQRPFAQATGHFLMPQAG